MQRKRIGGKGRKNDFIRGAGFDHNYLINNIIDITYYTISVEIQSYSHAPFNNLPILP